MFLGSQTVLSFAAVLEREPWFLLLAERGWEYPSNLDVHMTMHSCATVDDS
jgi:hypothetical protein